MGYYTKYLVKILNADGSPDTSNVWDWLHTNDKELFETVNHSGDECKWYEHDNDMRKLSIRFPDSVFILSGEGEESGDVWKKYYMNGSLQEARGIITFDDFDPNKLDVCPPTLVREVKAKLKAEAIRSATFIESVEEKLYDVKLNNVSYRVVIRGDNEYKVTYVYHQDGAVVTNSAVIAELKKIIEEKM